MLGFCGILSGESLTFRVRVQRVLVVVEVEIGRIDDASGQNSGFGFAE